MLLEVRAAVGEDFRIVHDVDVARWKVGLAGTANNRVDGEFARGAEMVLELSVDASLPFRDPYIELGAEARKIGGHGRPVTGALDDVLDRSEVEKFGQGRVHGGSRPVAFEVAVDRDGYFPAGVDEQIVEVGEALGAHRLHELYDGRGDVRPH